jgi:hypothetical protein
MRRRKASREWKTRLSNGKHLALVLESMKLIRRSGAMVALLGLLATGGEYGCWRQYPAPTPSLYQFYSSLQTPIGSAYPGTRELMDAPSNDPALNNDRNGVELRP